MKTDWYPVAIGNGIYAQARRGKTLLEQHRERQRLKDLDSVACAHCGSTKRTARALYCCRVAASRIDQFQTEEN